MAYEIGTATNRADLMARFISFLTTNADLVADSQQWTVLSEVGGPPSTDFLLRGPGLAGDDQVHVRLYSSSIPASDIYGWSSQAFVSYNNTLSHDLQPGISDIVGMALWDNAMPYWFIANGRRFIVIVKVSTIFSSMYAGLYLPFATPSEMPYPIFVAGSHESATTHRWSQADHNVGGFFDPSEGNAYLRHHDGTWLLFANYSNGSGGSRAGVFNNNVWPYAGDHLLRENADGSQSLMPCYLHSNYSGGNVYGQLDGVFFTTAFGLGSEDIVEIGSDDYLVVQSVYRTTRTDYAAIKLE